MLMGVNTRKKTEAFCGKEGGESRRRFLKKSVYAAPTLMALGALLKPKDAEAGFGPPPSDANGW